MKKAILKIPSIRAIVTNRKLSNVIRVDKKYFKIFNIFVDYTMCQEYKYIRNLSLVDKFKHIKGDVIECGTWKGGMIGGIATMLQDQKRTYFLCDSYEGLPPAKEIDGKAAIDWQNDTTSEHYLDNCTAEENDAHSAMKLSKASEYRILKGWFDKTLLTLDDGQTFAILRLDGDWYESTMTCLEILFPKVVKGGIIIIDDYYTWEGCTKAVHDYLSKYKLSNTIHQHMDTIAYIIK